MGNDENEVRRATVGSVPLSGESSDASSDESASSGEDPLTRFKHEQLRCVVMDEPWDTSLTWADAQTDLREIDASERDRAVAYVLVQMYDEGLAYFFEVEDFAENYSRTPSEAEKLSREHLA